MNRRETNAKPFEHLPIPMQLRYVKRIARKYGIDLTGIRIRIDRDPHNLNWDVTGEANPSRIGDIILLPNAFISEEIVARTLFHEKIHIEQFRQYGSEYVQNNHVRFEKEAYTAETERFERS
ncbi:MAG: hypothetical protein FWG68_11350 [Defluviitaleaceae bacterium]|nr:hypothetical protein [Defluviitaleaceae bacterium]